MADGTDGGIVDLRAKRQALADPAALARGQVRDARLAVQTSEVDFARQLTECVGWEVTDELVKCWETEIVPPGDVLASLPIITGNSEPQVVESLPLAGVEAAFRTRAEFVSSMALDELLGNASDVRAVGISHNLICQQFPNDKLTAMLNSGGTVEVLFLRPGGESIAQREEEEGYEIGNLSNLTSLNLSILLSQVRPKLSANASANLGIGTYDETIRFNLIFIDHALCVMQPYLHGIRGIQTPTLVVGKQPSPGIYETMWACYEWLRDRARFQ